MIARAIIVCTALVFAFMICAPPSAAQIATPVATSNEPGCDPTVQTGLARLAIARIDAETELAGQFYRVLDEAEFRALSCLERLLGGISIIFAPPGIGNILDAIFNRLCGLAQQHVARAMRPLHQSVTFGPELDAVLPGLGLGRLRGFAAIAPTARPGVSVHVHGHGPVWQTGPGPGVFARDWRPW